MRSVAGYVNYPAISFLGLFSYVRVAVLTFNISRIFLLRGLIFMKHPSVMNHSFSKVPVVDIPRSQFDRSHGLKTTFNSGYLIPFFLDEVLPGDTFNLNANGFCRMATPINPVMDNLHLETFFFFVPTRLVWNNFVKMMGEQDNPDDSIDYEVPYIMGDTTPDSFTFEVGSLADYFGLPTDVPFTAADRISCLPFRVYWLCYNTWFRDQNLQDSRQMLRTDGPDVYGTSTIGSGNFDINPARRGKRHDYFTSATPWPQKGPDVLLPLGSTADLVQIGSASSSPVMGLGVISPYGFDINPTGIRQSDGSQTTPGTDWRNMATDPSQILMEGTADPGYPNVRVETADLISSMEVDLSTAVGATLAQFREAMQIQMLYERDARGGTRYIELIKSHFGVTSPDARLQRPEYLGGGSVPINITPVFSSGGIENGGGISVRPVGEPGAFGVGHFQRHGFTKSFTEHGFVLGLVNVRADLTYQQGLNRMWSRRDKLDFYWPALSQLGEQTVLNKEIYAQGVSAGADDNDVFGYQERYAEYRYKPSVITGEFRSTYAQSLDPWHLAQEFSDLPVLGDDFIQDNPPVDRVIAASSYITTQFIADFYFKFKAARPMPLFGIPASLGRF